MPKADSTLPLHWLLNLTSVTKRVGGTPLCCPNLLETGLSGHGVIQRAKQREKPLYSALLLRLSSLLFNIPRLL